MTRLTWRLWKLLAKARRGNPRQRRQKLGISGLEQTTVESLESRALLVGDASGAITGTAFIDADRDGQLDARPADARNEIKMPGVTLKLSGRTTTGVDVNIVPVKTRADGTFTFQNVMPGRYRLVALRADNATVLSKSSVIGNITVTGGQTVTRNFAFASELAPQLLSIRGFRTNATPNFGLTFSAPGTTDAEVNDRENWRPTLLNGTPDEISVGKNASQQVIDLSGVFDDPDMTDSLIRFKTTVGTTNRDIDVTLLDMQAPQTVANFFNYITSDRFDNTIFHRLVDNFVLQGGGFSFNDTTNTLNDVPPDEAVANEFDGTSRSNLRGTLAMAKVGGNPDSATSEFFFNLENNAGTSPNGLNFQNGGFTVFGRVETGSLDEMDALAGTAIRDQSPTPQNRPGIEDELLREIPLNNYPGPNNDPNFLTTVTPTNLVRLNDVEILRRDEFLTYSIVSNSNPSLVTATIGDAPNRNLNRLFLDFTEDAIGTAEITIRATDKFGATLDTTFQIEVQNTAPTATVTLSPQNPAAGGFVTANATKFDADGDDVMLTYKWTVDGNVVATHEKPDLTDQINLSDFSNVAPGDIVRVEVTPNDGTENGTTRNATTTVNQLPVIDSLMLSSATPETNDMLTATVTRSDANNDNVTLTYVWKVEGTEVQRTTTLSLMDTLDLALMDQGDVGQTITVEVTPNDGKEDGATEMEMAVVANTAPSLDPPVLTPEHPTDASTLQVSVAPGDPDLTQTLSFRYVWKINELEVQDETSNDTTNVLNQLFGAGDLVSVEVTPNDGLTDGTTVMAMITIEANTPPVISSVVITPQSPVATDLLQADVVVGDINGGQDVMLTYVWRLNDGAVPIREVTKSDLFDELDLSLFSLNPGDEITVEVTPNDGFDGGLTEADSVIIR